MACVGLGQIIWRWPRRQQPKVLARFLHGGFVKILVWLVLRLGLLPAGVHFFHIPPDRVRVEVLVFFQLHIFRLLLLVRLSPAEPVHYVRGIFGLGANRLVVFGDEKIAIELEGKIEALPLFFVNFVRLNQGLITVAQLDVLLFELADCILLNLFVYNHLLKYPL